MTNTIDRTNVQYLFGRTPASGEYTQIAVNTGPLFAVHITTTTQQHVSEEMAKAHFNNLIKNQLLPYFDQPLQRNSYNVARGNMMAIIQITKPGMICMISTSKFTDFEYEDAHRVGKEFKSILESIIKE